MSHARRAWSAAAIEVPSQEWKYILNEVSAACLHSIQRLMDPSLEPDHSLSSSRPRTCRGHLWACDRCGGDGERIHDPCI